MRAPHGFTLAEAVVVLAICAVLALVALPALSGLVLDNRMAAASNDLLHALRGAWIRAQVDVGEVVVCRSPDGRQCAPAGATGDWAAGWIVFLNRNGDDPPKVDAGEPILAVQARVPGLRIGSNRSAYVLRRVPYRATNGTLTLCDRRGAAAGRAVIVGVLGRARVSRQSASGTALVCPP
jgi:type IV fimbrial biogenesis protein FimT